MSRTMRTSQIPTGEFDRQALRGRVTGALESPGQESILETSVQILRRVRPDMDDDGIVQTFVAELCALLPARRLVVRLLGRQSANEEAALWATGPLLAGRAERFVTTRASLERHGLGVADARAVDIAVSEEYQPEFHPSAAGFHVPITVLGRLVGIVSVEYFPGATPPPGDVLAVSQIVLHMGGALAQSIAREDSVHLEEQIVQAEKLATLGQLAAGVVHELNNPLTSISAYASYLRDKRTHPDADAGDREKLDRIVHAANRILRFTKDLTAYARPSFEPSASVDLGGVLEQSVVFCEHVLREAGAQVSLHAEPGLPRIEGVEGHLHQVFINLITNACHAMPEGAGELSIEARKAGKRTVEVRVSDNGAGIAEELHESIFQPFFSTKGEGKGTGLGLSIVRNLVQQNGGTIWVESAIGDGATFIVQLPTASPFD